MWKRLPDLAVIHGNYLKSKVDLSMFYQLIHRIIKKSQISNSRDVNCGYVCLKSCEFNFCNSQLFQKYEREIGDNKQHGKAEKLPWFGKTAFQLKICMLNLQSKSV